MLSWNTVKLTCDAELSWRKTLAPAAAQLHAPRSGQAAGEQRQVRAVQTLRETRALHALCSCRVQGGRRLHMASN